MAKRKPDATDAYLAELRLRGVEFTEGRTATFPEITPQTKPQEISATVCSTQLAKPRKSKYGAIKTEVNGITFDSKKEAKRYIALRQMEDAGEIRDLQLQPKFDLVVNGVKVGKYVADFKYCLKRPDRWEAVVEDCKGMKTPVYRLKKKIVEAMYSIGILET